MAARPRKTSYTNSRDTTAGAVAHPVEVVLRAAEGAQHLALDSEDVTLAVSTDQVDCRSPPLK